MKWLWQLLWDPVAALDLCDNTGAIDHGKIIGFFTFLTVFGAVLLYVVNVGKLIPLGHTIALISTAYGWAGWRMFLKSRAVQVRQENTTTETMEAASDESPEPDLFTDDESDLPKGQK